MTNAKPPLVLPFPSYVPQVLTELLPTKNVKRGKTKEEKEADKRAKKQAGEADKEWNASKRTEDFCLALNEAQERELEERRREAVVGFQDEEAEADAQRRLLFREILVGTGLLMPHGNVQLAAVCTKSQKPLFLQVQLLFFLLCFSVPELKINFRGLRSLSQARAMRSTLPTLRARLLRVRHHVVVTDFAQGVLQERISSGALPNDV